MPYEKSTKIKLIAVIKKFKKTNNINNVLAGRLYLMLEYLLAIYKFTRTNIKPNAPTVKVAVLQNGISIGTATSNELRINNAMTRNQAMPQKIKATEKNLTVSM
jgi:hypothetical protein